MIRSSTLCVSVLEDAQPVWTHKDPPAWASTHTRFLKGEQAFLNGPHLFKGPVIITPVCCSEATETKAGVCAITMFLMLCVCVWQWGTNREINENNHCHQSVPSLFYTDRYLPQQNNFVPVSFSPSFCPSPSVSLLSLSTFTPLLSVHSCNTA